MNRLVGWTARHKAVAFDLLRIYLGVALVVKGVQIVSDVGAFASQIEGFTLGWETAAVAHMVAMAHIGGGALLALGLLTRTAALVQLPALLGATFLVEWPAALTATTPGFELAALVLVLLGVFSFTGAGPLSVDAALGAVGTRSPERPRPAAVPDEEPHGPHPVPSHP